MKYLHKLGRKFSAMIIVMLLTVCGTQSAQATFYTKHLGYSDGLSSQRVFSIVEDRHGAMWISTKSGIDRYNGNRIKNYALNGTFHYGDMAGRQIRLFYDRAHGLWAYDNTGRIYHYSPETDMFEQQMSLADHIKGGIVLYKMIIDPAGNMWVSLLSGVYSIDRNGRVKKQTAGSGTNDVITAGRKVLAATNKGVFSLSTDSRPRLVTAGCHDASTLFYDARDNRLWIGTFNSGVLVADLGSGRLRHVETGTGGLSTPVRAIVGLDRSSVLIGTDGGGVLRTDRRTLKAVRFISNYDNDAIYINGNGVYAVTVDRGGNIWVGSYTGGVSVVMPKRQTVTRLVHERGIANSMSSNNVNAVVEDAAGNVWFGCDPGLSIRHKNGTWTHSLDNIVIVSLCRASNGGMWAGTYGNGLYKLDSHGNIVRHLTMQQGGLSTNSIFAVYEDSEGDVWVGGLDGKLMVLGWDGARCHFPITFGQVIKPVGKGVIAVGTGDGFYTLNKYTGAIKHYFSSTEFSKADVSTYIDDLLIGRGGNVWLATEGGGLVCYNMRTGKVRMYTTADGLPSNDVFCLLADLRGRIWLSTGKGVALMEHGAVKSLNYIEGLDNEYNKSAGTILGDGRIVFGGTSGAVMFPGSVLTEAHYKARLRFTAFTPAFAGNEEREKLAPELFAMLADGHVRTDFWHRTFTISFEAINHNYQQDIAYQYMLKGYDSGWSAPTADGEARYTMVNPGHYTMLVRCIRVSDRTVLSEKALEITVEHPWWNTWLAWTLYVIAVGAVAYIIIMYNGNMLKKRYDEDKIRFFINTAHDIRTPVTLIKTPLEDLSRNESIDHNGRYLLDLALRNTHKLNEMITRLLDFERADTGRQVNLEPTLVGVFIREKVSVFEPSCTSKGLTLNLELPAEDLCVMSDRHILDAILDNLLSNAVKYTGSGGTITVSLTAGKRRFAITVTDTGIGIPDAAKRHLFNDIYRADNARNINVQGSGFGLLQVRRLAKLLGGRISFTSAEGKGSSFTVEMKRRDTDARPAAPVVRPMAPADNADTEPDRTEITTKEHAEADTLLVVEDNNELRGYLANMLSEDYNVKAAADGEEALEYLKDNYPDLILSDVMMPGIQGDELCRRVKNNPDTAGIPVVLLTAKANHDAIVEGLGKGADDYIPKPFDTDILKAKIRGIIENRRRMRAVFMRQALEQVRNDGTPKAPVGTQNDNNTDRTTGPKAEEKPAKGNPADASFVDKATAIILENLSDSKFSITDLCREMAMSRTLFYSRLKSLTDKGPQEFIRIIRLEKAAAMLRSGMKVSDVSVRTGFTNSKYFSVLFKKAYGTEPSKYMKNMEENAE